MTKGLTAYGGEVNVFDKAGIEHLFEAAAHHGWIPITQPEFDCHHKVVHWERLGLHFTFYTLVLKLIASPTPNGARIPNHGV